MNLPSICPAIFTGCPLHFLHPWRDVAELADLVGVHVGVAVVGGFCEAFGLDVVGANDSFAPCDRRRFGSTRRRLVKEH